MAIVGTFVFVEILKIRRSMLPTSKPPPLALLDTWKHVDWDSHLTDDAWSCYGFE